MSSHWHRIALALLIGAALVGGLSAKEVVVASYNVENYLSMKRRVGGKSANAPKPEEEKAAVVEAIKEISPDVLGIIEIGTEADLEDLRLRLKAAGIDYPHKEWVKGADEARHVALLSKLPIVARNSRDDVPFELNGQHTRIGRGILDVSVALSDSENLRLIGLHLKSRREVPEFDQVAMRAKEAWHVRRHLDEVLGKNPDQKLIVFGDLNDTKNEYPVKEIAGSSRDPLRLKDLFLTDRYGYRWTHYWSTADIYSRIDYLLVSRGLLPDIIKEKSGISSAREWYKGSDHRAVFATLNVK